MSETAETMAAPDATTALARWLASDNEVLRSAAVRAFAAADLPGPQIRVRLLDALLDPDPDIRSDAMEALGACALPADAETIETSLSGDPVREVKLAACKILGDLNAAGSRDLLRRLVLSRCEEEVAWEDDLGDWEDWLDIQIASIQALGRMGATDAIEDLFAARDDEFAQTLDGPVFEALARMGADGVTWLLAVMETETGLGRKRAAAALADADPRALEAHLDTLLESPDTALRLLAVERLGIGTTEQKRLAAEDPAPAVRCAAVARLCDQTVSLRALSNSHESVQVAALDVLQMPLPADVQESVADNLIAWLTSAGPALATAAARNLPRFAPDRAAAPLLELALQAGSALETRVAAVRALSGTLPAVPTADLAALLAAPASQVRTAALLALRSRAEDGDAEAMDLLANAIAGTQLTEDEAFVDRSAEDGPDVATPKGEFSGRPRIHITPDGEIVEVDEQPATAHSTLDAILDVTPIGDATPRPEPLAEETPEESSGKRRKRRAVEGPDAIASALSFETVQTLGGFRSSDVRTALLARVQDSDDALRRAVWQCLAEYDTAPDLEAAARVALDDSDPVVRQSALTLLLRNGHDAVLLAKALGDEDPLIRAGAVETLTPAEACAHLNDPAAPVRVAAVSRVLAGDEACARSAAGLLLAGERADTLATLIAASPAAGEVVLRQLAVPDLAARKALILLTALADRAKTS